MKIDQNYLRELTYTTTNFKELELILTMGDDDENNSSGVGIKDGKPLTENALKQLCSALKIPYAFTKQLRANSNTHIIPYLQRQLSRSKHDSIVLVNNDKNILSVADMEDLHYCGKEAIAFDTRLRESLDKQDHPLELANVFFADDEICYSMRFKDPERIETDDGDEGGANDLQRLWKWGFTVRHSPLGVLTPGIGVELLRMVCANLTYLPAKSYSFPMPYEDDFEERWNHVATFLENPPQPHWMTLTNLVDKLSRTTASFREVSEARKKLLKLKVDKEDTETAERINNALHWKRIRKAYAINEMDEKPARAWYAKATTPLSLFSIYNLITREATHAPSTLDVDLRQNILIYAGNILTGKPDLYMQPPSINWDLN